MLSLLKIVGQSLKAETLMRHNTVSSLSEYLLSNAGLVDGPGSGVTHQTAETVPEESAAMAATASPVKARQRFSWFKKWFWK